MAKLKHKSFKDWQAEEVELAFDIDRKRTLPFLEHIKTIKLADDHQSRSILEAYRLELFDFIDSWNEDEYKFFFISPFLKQVNFSSQYYKGFTQRPMSVNYDNDTKTTSGNVEFMLAKGRQIPRQPHFFLHEYKPEKNRDNDPLGQLLIAMIAAQKVNEDNQPIYGIYVNGRNWFFVNLIGKDYSVSNPYVATTDEIYDLFAVLQYVAGLMEEMYSRV
jgi:hypothetical protein